MAATAGGEDARALAERLTAPMESAMRLPDRAERVGRGLLKVYEVAGSTPPPQPSRPGRPVVPSRTAGGR